MDVLGEGTNIFKDKGGSGNQLSSSGICHLMKKKSFDALCLVSKNL